jgi:TolA-binding protein
MQLDQLEDALSYYEKAVAHSDNDFTAPKFLYKAGITALELGKNDKAEEYFTRIKEEYASSDEASTIDVFIGKTQNND